MDCRRQSAKKSSTFLTYRKSMKDLKEYSNQRNEEVTAGLSRVDRGQVENFLQLIQGARRIALYGGGREGLMIRALAMRLFHLGNQVSVVGGLEETFLPK